MARRSLGLKPGLRLFLHTALVLTLTVLTQLGGLAWLIGLCFRRRVLAFVLSYAALSFAALWVAPLTGRSALPCHGSDLYQMHSPLYCVMNRHYVAPELHQAVAEFAAQMEAAHPGTQTRILDANFPFLTGFPLLPHLSHDDGAKVDLAFFYADDSGYLPGKTRSPIGYFAFEDGPTQCPKTALSLRWDMGWLQPLWPRYTPDPARMTTALALLSADPRITKIFIEPHLAQRFQAQSPKIRFQGCRAARHDDHIHIQL